MGHAFYILKKKDSGTIQYKITFKVYQVPEAFSEVFSSSATKTFYQWHVIHCDSV